MSPRVAQPRWSNGRGRLVRVAVVLERWRRSRTRPGRSRPPAPRRRRRRRCAPGPSSDRPTEPRVGAATPPGRWRRSRRPRCPSSTRGRSVPTTRAWPRFTSGGQGAAAWITISRLDRSAAAAPPRVQLQQAHEVGRHELHVGHPVPLDGVEDVLGIEAVDHDDGAAEALRRRRPAQRGRVVERRRAEVGRRRAEPVQTPARAHRTPPPRAVAARRRNGGLIPFGRPVVPEE